MNCDNLFLKAITFHVVHHRVNNCTVPSALVYDQIPAKLKVLTLTALALLLCLGQ